jgi:hypothetical protein
MNEVYRFELSSGAFDWVDEGIGVGGLNGGCDLRMVRKYWEEETEQGAIVYASAPSYDGAKIPQLLPSTEEMISDYDLYKRNIINWFKESKKNIRPIPGKRMILESFLTDYISIWDDEISKELGGRNI